MKSKIPIFNLNLNTSNVDKTQLTVSVQINIITPIFIINEMDKIVNGLWLGGHIPESVLIDNEFTHVLSIIDKKPEHMTCTHFITKWINIEDDGKVKIEQYFDECNKFIHDGIMKGGKVYVHCQRGLSRSPTIIIAYLMRFGPCMTFDEALNHVSSKRPTICPNLGFTLALREYENHIKAIKI